MLYNTKKNTSSTTYSSVLGQREKRWLTIEPELTRFVRWAAVYVQKSGITKHDVYAYSWYSDCVKNGRLLNINNYSSYYYTTL